MKRSGSGRAAAGGMLGALGCVLALTLGSLLAPLASANTTGIPTPTVTVGPLPTSWSAIGSGTLAAPDVTAGTGVIVGSEVKASIGTVDFAGTAGPGTFSTSWLSCPARGAADAACTSAEAAASQSGNPSGLTRTYVPKAEDVGRFLRFSLSVVPTGAAARTATSDPSKDVYVLGAAPTGAQPEVKAGLAPGDQGIALLKKWTIPPTSTFRSREASAWACTSSTAGQSPARDFSPSGAGCTSLPVLTAVAWVADPTAIVFTIPSDAAGKYLLVSDSVTTSTGPALALSTYVVRSAAVPLKGTAPGTASPTATPSATPTATPTPTSTAQAGGTPTMSVTAVRKAMAGQRYSVSITVTPAGSTGIANVRLVTRNAKAKTVQTLSSVQVSNGAGTSASTVTAKPGRYALIVQYVDTKTGQTLTYSRKVRVQP